MTTPTLGDLQTDFLVSYEGPALAAHTMQIRDLAPALLALGQAFDRANSVLNGDRASMSLEIRATQEGSFEIALLLKQLYDSGVAAFSSDFISSAANIKKLFFGSIVLGSGGAGGIGLIGLIKRLKGKRVTVATTEGPNMVLEIENLRLTIPSELFKLYQDMPLRDQLAAVIRPVAKAGIDRVKFKDVSRELDSVDKDEAQFFRGAEEDYANVTTSVIPRQRLKPSTVSFVQKGKWKLNDGEKTRWYTVTDQSFLDQINAGAVRVGAKDVFICQVLMKQLFNDDGDLKMEYEISSVLDHIPPTEQARLLNDDDAGITFKQSQARGD